MMKILLFMLVLSACTTPAKTPEEPTKEPTAETSAKEAEATPEAKPEATPTPEAKADAPKAKPELKIEKLEVKAESCEHTDTSFHCATYVKNYDADTITFDIKGLHPLLGKSIGIRVNGIDTPEMRGGSDCEKAKSKEAKKLVEDMMKAAKRIDLLNIDKGKYFRVVADVIADGKSVAKMLIETKYAYPYNGGTKLKIDWCKELAPQVPADYKG